MIAQVLNGARAEFERSAVAALPSIHWDYPKCVWEALFVMRASSANWIKQSCPGTSSCFQISESLARREGELCKSERAARERLRNHIHDEPDQVSLHITLQHSTALHNRAVTKEPCSGAGSRKRRWRRAFCSISTS